MSFSIITVNYNNVKGLNKTINNIEKVKAKTNSAIELIVIDGGSTDDSVNVIQNNSTIIDKWVSEKDEGIFDAMNKGIDLASNDWLVFMNSGDTFYYENILSIFKSEQIDNSINFVYGNKIENGEVGIVQNIEVLKAGVIHACHQSMFFKRKLNIKYDKNTKLYGDYGYVVDHVKPNPEGVYYFNHIVSETEPYGVGSKVSFRKRYEKYHQVISRFGFVGFVLSIFHRIKKIFKLL
ncbi:MULTISPECIES: glycosyltransferase [unclassified Colwellia]|jgi:glycosyltransferase involved in cell wall biosynthesis|uniref:glycosyltransferase n=1 Tax=unclassified Colwellia TaxID=196834 RepID=UPI0015F3AA54|nr:MULTISPECIES: glycosyltransferase [unclassified Colwellia]MBA6381050.1 glycosyltransferase [Colwellia sp. BRX10-7]MBA6388698.1 glycosyltransferase [Colwellia sp. BRX10-2]MBA6400022.1 glycosyltransferase [Colwellia sp. BRX10-5]MBA6403901.1 glycosyltransferase [Colwellia sp. BRX10-1]